MKCKGHFRVYFIFLSVAHVSARLFSLPENISKNKRKNTRDVVKVLQRKHKIKASL